MERLARKYSLKWPCNPKGAKGRIRSFKQRWSNTPYYLANCKANKPHSSGESVIEDRLQFQHRVHTSYEVLEYMWSVEFSAFYFYCLSFKLNQSISKEEHGGVGGGISVRWPECFQVGIVFLQKEQVDMRRMNSQRLLRALTLTSVAFLHQHPFSRTQLTFCPLASGKLWIWLENAAILLLENLVTLLEQAQNKHLLTFARQHFFFLFFHFIVTNEERGMQRTLCRTIEQILPASRCTTCKVCGRSPLLGLHFPSSAGLCPTDQLSDGWSRKRSEAVELYSSSAADVSS